MRNRDGRLAHDLFPREAKFIDAFPFPACARTGWRAAWQREFGFSERLLYALRNANSRPQADHRITARSRQLASFGQTVSITAQLWLESIYNNGGDSGRDAAFLC